MDVQDFFPIWAQLMPSHQQILTQSAIRRSIPKGTMLHSGSTECTGLLLVCSGQLRAFILSDEGREITLYRLFERDICLFSASCMLRSMQFELMIAAEKDTQLFVIPADVYQSVAKESASAANFTTEIMAARFSDVMWLMEQIMWKSFDRRLARFLLDESALEGTAVLHLTHETIANHLGTAREVVTRMLRYFQSEGLVRLSRGSLQITNKSGLEVLGDA